MSAVIVDTCVWIEAFRNARSPEATELSSLIDSDSVVLTGVVIAELLQGIQNPDNRKNILSKFEPFSYLEVTKKTWQSAGNLAGDLRKKGIILPLSDILIAVLALAHGLLIYTLDPHFRYIPNIKLYKPV